MSLLDVDLSSLSVDERLRLIDALWESIERSAAGGDSTATQALESWSSLESAFLDELEREADEAEKDPSSLTSWEDLLVELKRKYG